MDKAKDAKAGKDATKAPKGPAKAGKDAKK